MHHMAWTGVTALLSGVLLATVAEIQGEDASWRFSASMFDRVCLGKDPVMCHSLAHCQWNHDADLCFQAGKEPPCELLFQDFMCEKRKDCLYNHPHHICHELGSPLPCQSISEKLECQLHGHCVFNEMTHTCHFGDRVQPCSSAPDEKSCSTLAHCEYFPSLVEHAFFQGLCFEKGVDFACDILDEKSCEKVSKQCRWVSTVQFCTHRHHKLPCNVIGANKNVCTKQKHCEFLDEANQCIAKGISVPCAALVYENACKGNKQCKWSPSATVCLPKGTRAPCRRIYSEELCNARKQCHYDKPSGTCLEESETKSPCYDIHIQPDCDSAPNCQYRFSSCMDKGVPSCSDMPALDGCAVFGCEVNPDRPMWCMDAVPRDGDSDDGLAAYSRRDEL
eukprot:m.266523 g.266523  ORF g.266523 m.266523 type:complete len:392 (+) comp15631_c0_seq3:2123-3298(+)